MHLILRNKSNKPRKGLNNNSSNSNNSSSKKTIFSGTFTLEKDENYEQFLKQIGKNKKQTFLLKSEDISIPYFL
jgi:hypothetical protein